jgi:serine/threonine protein kinase
MIKVDTSERISAAKILDHPWILQYKNKCETDECKHDHEKLSKEVVDKLRAYKGESILKRTAINILVKQLEPHQIESLS